ncbi:hypothetical protein V2J09_021908 [Rumex salicifolius]
MVDPDDEELDCHPLLGFEKGPSFDPWEPSTFSFDSSSPIHGGEQLNFLIALQIHSDFWFDAGQEIPKKLIVSYPGGMRCTSNDFINEIIY